MAGGNLPMPLNSLLRGGGLKFDVVTLGGDVLTTMQNLPNGITYFANSNNPTNKPNLRPWGAYLILKCDGRARAIYIDSTGIAITEPAINSSSTEISWKLIDYQS